MFRRDAGNERGTFGLLDTRPPVRVGKAVGPKAHVLVCAPSNSALDEIVSRLLQAGLLDWCVAWLRTHAHNVMSCRHGTLHALLH